MSHDVRLVPSGHFEIEQAQVLSPEVPAALPPPAPASPEQVRAVDAVFAQDDEHSTVADLLAFYCSALFLTDLAKEHFRPPVDEIPAGDQTEDKPEEN